MKPLSTLPFLLVCGLPDIAIAQSPSADSLASGPVLTIDRTLLVDTIRNDSAEMPGHYTYRFRNTGTAPLIISTVRSSDPCFCDRWPREPVMRGRSAELRVLCPPMNGSTRQGSSFTIVSNAPSTTNFRVQRVRVP